LLCWVLLKDWGLIPALIGAGLFVVVDPHSRLYGRAILTEASSALLIALLCILLVERTYKRKKWTGVFATGIVFGLAILARSAFVLWLPVLLVMVFWLSASKPEIHVSEDREGEGGHPLGASGSAEPPLWNWIKGFVNAGTFVFVVAATLIPWGIRNCQLLGEFMPLGSQGAGQLSAGYSDVAWEHSGTWQNLEARGFFDGVVTKEMTPIEKELATARYSRDQARQWIAANPRKALALFPLKVYQEFRPCHVPQAVLLALAVTGALAGWGNLYVRVGLGLVFANAVSIGLTWSVADGRFLVPLLFVQHLLAAVGAWWVVRRVVRISPHT
jgi:hypothetical protein